MIKVIEESSSTTVAVNESEETSGIDFKLDRSGSISGRVFAPDGTTPIAGATLTASGTSFNFSRSGASNAAGSYQISGLPSGNFQVKVAAGGYLSGYYGETGTAIIPVAVTAPADTPGIKLCPG